MKLFVSDLDQTLIYSYKKDIGPDKELVETKEGKALSFMTKRSYQMLRAAAQRCCFVPVTTRSLEQYNRLRLPSSGVSEYALVANGGLLLRRGGIDQEWYRGSLELCRQAEGTLGQAEELLKRDYLVDFEVRRVDGLFVFTKSQRPEVTAEGLRRKLDMQAVKVLTNGTKIYVMPGNLEKGMALRRLQSLLRAERIVAAGDSEFDVSMLLEAHEAWFPEGLLGSENVGLRRHPGKRVAPEGRLFSDWLLEGILAEFSGERGG